jgi:AraC-like DNA-binding protein
MRLHLHHSTTTDANARHASTRHASTRHATAHPACAPHGGAHLHYWRPVPREVADVVCGEGAVTELPLHTHEALRVMLPTSRFAVVDGRGRATVVSPGCVHVVAPLTLHAARGVDDVPCGMRVILVSPRLLAQLGDALHQPDAQTPSTWCHVADDAALYAELWALFEELRRPLVDLDCVPRLLACLARLLAPRAEPPGAGGAHVERRVAGVEHVGDHLREHVAEHVSLDELARVAGLSKFYLLRVFRVTHGLTPHAYQMQLRLARAWRLITEGSPLSRTTYDAGFADQSHLTRRFGAAFGLTPARYARQLAVAPGIESAGAFAAPSAA